MRFYIVIFSLFIFTELHSQVDEKTIYILPDSVEMRVSQYLDAYNCAIDKGVKFCFILSTETNWFKISIMSYSTQDKELSWITRTNRYLLVKDQFFPLLFDYDMFFGTTDESYSIFGNRDGMIKRTYIAGDFFSIEFTKKGEIIKIGY